METLKDYSVKQETVTVIAPFEVITKTLDAMVEEKINDYCNYNLDDKLESAIDNYDFDDKINNFDFDDKLESAINDYDFSDAIDKYDFDDKVSSALDDYDFSDAIDSAIDIDDLAGKVKEYIDTPNPNDMAYDLLKSFNIDNNCKTGELFVDVVEIIIAKYNEKLKLHAEQKVEELKSPLENIISISELDFKYVLKNTLSIGDATIKLITDELARLARG